MQAIVFLLNLVLKNQIKFHLFLLLIKNKTQTQCITKMKPPHQLQQGFMLTTFFYFYIFIYIIKQSTRQKINKNKVKTKQINFTENLIMYF